MFMKKIAIALVFLACGYGVLHVRGCMQTDDFEREARWYHDDFDKKFVEKIYHMAVRDGALSEFERGEYFARIEGMRNSKPWMDSYGMVARDLLRKMQWHCLDLVSQDEGYNPHDNPPGFLAEKEFEKRYPELHTIERFRKELYGVRLFETKPLNERRAEFATLKEKMNQIIAQK